MQADRGFHRVPSDQGLQSARQAPENPGSWQAHRQSQHDVSDLRRVQTAIFHTFPLEIRHDPVPLPPVFCIPPVKVPGFSDRSRHL